MLAMAGLAMGRMAAGGWRKQPGDGRVGDGRAVGGQDERRARRAMGSLAMAGPVADGTGTTAVGQRGAGRHSASDLRQQVW